MIIENSFSGKKWKLENTDHRQYLMLSQKYQLDEIITKILTVRKIQEQDVSFFLNPNIQNEIPEPYLFKDMEKSVNRVVDSILKKEKIAIIADYDVDGATSAAILIKFFRFININLHLEIPDRISEGYGPNKRIIESFKKNHIDLIISLDCGTSSFEIFNKNYLKDIDVIVIDHHISEMHFPYLYGLINPNRYDESNEYKNLAAVGVTFLFLIALRRKLRSINYYDLNNIPEHNLTSYLDLVALGTVCDVVSLTKFNRALVHKGLEIIWKRLNKGIATLIDISNIRHQPNTFDLSYNIGPKLNAASRIGDSKLASKILSSDDFNEIENIAKKLQLLNEKRKLIENKVLDEAREMALIHNNKKYLVLDSFDWHPGVIGIVASKLVDEFNKPVFIISKKEEEGVGSARSIPGIDLGLLLLEAKQNDIIIKGGGHKMAAGLTIKNEKINILSDYLEKKIKMKNYNDLKPSILVDSIISIEQINSQLLDNLEDMEPYGNGNPDPKFIIKNLNLNYIKIIKEKHIILSFKNNLGNLINGICFNKVNTSIGEKFLNSKDRQIHIVGNIKRNHFSHKEVAQLIIIDGAYAD